jgi:hypothetical protein
LLLLKLHSIEEFDEESSIVKLSFRSILCHLFYSSGFAKAVRRESRRAQEKRRQELAAAFNGIALGGFF